MAFLDRFRKQHTLSSIKIEDLNTQLKTLEISERSLSKQLESTNAKREILLKDYKKAREEGNDVQAVFLTRQFEAIKPEIDSLQNRHNTLIKQRRVVHGLKLMKENTEFVSNLGGGVFSKLSITELQPMIEKATAEGELNEERLNDMVATLDIGLSPAQGVGNDDLLSEMDKIAYGTDTGIADEVAQGLSKIDSALADLDKQSSPSAERQKNLKDDA